MPLLKGGAFCIETNGGGREGQKETKSVLIFMYMYFWIPCVYSRTVVNSAP